MALTPTNEPSLQSLLMDLLNVEADEYGATKDCDCEACAKRRANSPKSTSVAAPEESQETASSEEAFTPEEAYDYTLGELRQMLMDETNDMMYDPQRLRNEATAKLPVFVDALSLLDYLAKLTTLIVNQK